MYDQVYIGIDQSYQNTGISIVADGELKDVKSVQLHHYDTHSERRRALRNKLDGLLNVVAPIAGNVIVICERARLHGGPTSVISIDAIKAMGALTATIVDTAAPYNVPVYSVDTRCWKSQVVGTIDKRANSFGVPPEKWPTVQWCIEQGMENKIVIPITGRKTKGTFERNGKRYMYNNDAADSAAIAMFGVVGDPDKLKLEK